MIGYYRMARGWLEHSVFEGAPYSRHVAWIWLVEKAAFTPHDVTVSGMKIVLQRGQLTQSLRTIAETWQWNKDTARRFLKRLESEGMISLGRCCLTAVSPLSHENKTETATETPIKTAQLLISITNYDTYQSCVEDDETLPATGKKTRVRQRRDSSETIKNKGKEGEEREEEDSLPTEGPHRRPDDIATAVSVWNAMAARNVGVPPIRQLTDVRRQSLKARFADHGLAGWIEALGKIEQSDLCMGRLPGRDGAKPWVATFDFTIKASNLIKILEGNYDNRASARGSKPTLADHLRDLAEANPDVFSELAEGGSPAGGPIIDNVKTGY